ncbi:hypothetical protein [Enhygromyxa salina]|uniref:Uncharacterized protein n=1 Tax=Enhygromyxa salina TaxID=215803 RepID=A0A2S9XWS1_9BACT|nr:hypothetical protein [Enhygromyxa salina]PRP97327.1 hypothetical protein ENSA7_66770 [Enhygromyxa salina]
MTTPTCRLSISAVSLGLTALLSLSSSLAHAAPPADEPPGADAPEPEAVESELAPEPDLAPEPEPEPEPDPIDETDTNNEIKTPVDPAPNEGAAAPDPEPPAAPPSNIGSKHSITYTSLLAPRINPLGLEERLWIGYEYRLYDKDKTILNGSNLAIYFRPIVNPAITLIGATVQVQPAAVLRLRATYSYVQWFGTFQFMQTYKSPHDDYSETRLDAQADAGENYVTGGHQVELEALVQARYKGLVFRSGTFGIYNHYSNLRGDDDLFYAVRYDILAPAQGWLLTNDTDLLWLQDIKGPRHATAMFGARASTVMPFYKDEVYEEGDVIENPNGPQFKLGPALGYVFYDRPERRFNKPTLLMMPQWNLKHRWRTGRDVSTAFPTIVIAFVFSGQLWGSKR